MFCEFRCGIKVSDAECWSSAATPIFYERNLKTERFQNFHRRDTNVRFVITHEGVVPENDLGSSVAAVSDHRIRGSTIGGRRYSGVWHRRPTMSCEPFIEAFACIMWQGALRGYSGHRFHQSAHRFKI